MPNKIVKIKISILTYSIEHLLSEKASRYVLHVLLRAIFTLKKTVCIRSV